MARAAYQVRFEPTAGLVFRDARPFQAGETSVARNLPFPPPPAPFYFAAREALANAYRASSNPPTDERKRYLTARGYCLVRSELGQEERYFPCPLDLAQKEEDASGRWTLISPKAESGRVAFSTAQARYRTDRALGAWDPGPVFAWPEGRHHGTEGALMSAHQWLRYLEIGAAAPGAGFVAGEVLTPGEFFQSELRTGTQLDGRLATSGMLYTEQVLHLSASVRFEMGLELEARHAITTPPPACLPLGGESKSAHVTFAEGAWDGGFGEAEKASVKKSILNAARQAGDPIRVKLCLLTPLVAGANISMLRRYSSTPAWRPTWLNAAWTSDDRLPSPWWLQGRRGNAQPRYDLRLVAAIAGKPYPLGGWNPDHPEADPGPRHADPGPRPLYRCLPAGAVYFLELKPRPGVKSEAVVDDFFERVWLRTLLVKQNGTLTFFGRMGFGIAVAGGWMHGE